MAEDWLNWRAVYDDGSIFPQYDGDKENSYHNIDRHKLIAFCLKEPHTNTDVFQMELLKDQRLIFRRRIGMDANNGDIKYLIYLVGWQQTIKGKNIQSLHWIFPDGSVLTTGKFHEDNPLLCEVTWFDEEKS